MSKIINKKVDGFNMALDFSTPGISRVLSKQGYREKAFIQVLKDTVKEGMICMDLGANIGYATLNLLRECGESGFVYAVEPDPRNLTVLKQNIEQNDYLNNCSIYPYAISDEDGKLDFWMATASNLSGVKKGKKSIDSVEVEAFKLGTFLSDKKYPNFIKMDIEGHEVEVLNGALDYFENNNDGEINILMEMHPTLYVGDSMKDVLVKYFDMGFRARYVISTPVAQPDLFKERGYEPIEVVHTDGFIRGIYNNIKNEDVLDFACYTNDQTVFRNGSWITGVKIVRSIMITRG